MAVEYKNKKYFRLRGADSTLKTFSSTTDANTKIGFTSVYDTSTPTKTETLEDSGQTLVVTYEFDSDADQTAFQNAISDAWTNSPHSPFNPADATDTVEHFKNEWLQPDGSVGQTDLLI